VWGVVLMGVVDDVVVVRGVESVDDGGAVGVVRDVGGVVLLFGVENCGGGEFGFVLLSVLLFVFVFVLL
jgi:hypothetical protein